MFPMTFIREYIQYVKYIYTGQYRPIVPNPFLRYSMSRASADPHFLEICRIVLDNVNTHIHTRALSTLEEETKKTIACLDQFRRCNSLYNAVLKPEPKFLDI
jgi:hypothetical protein